MPARRPVDDLPPPTPRPAGAPLALGGLRVVDFTRFLAGPWCTQTLADFGADVVKIERPGLGDETRTFTPPEIAGESPYFLGLNRNKRSIALDLSRPAGREVAVDLARGSDILVENFAPGMMDRFGLGYGTLAAENPRLIYCSISGWAAGSGLADQPGFDSVFQAESGFMSLSGERDRQPMRTGAPVIDITASMNATIGILAALAARDRHGMGQRVEIALYDTAVTLLAYFGMNWLAGGADPVRNGNTAPVATPIGLFDCADGAALYVSCGTQKSWETLAVEVLERPDLATDPRFAGHRARNLHQAELMALLADLFRRRPREDWLARIREARAPVGAVRSVAEALRAPATVERGLAVRLEHPSGDPAPDVRPPFRLSATPVADPVAAPRLGADRDAVLAALPGYDAARIAALAAAGAFGAPAASSAD